MWDQARGLKQPLESKTARWDEKKTAEFYERVLREAGQIARRSVSSGFEESRKKTGPNSKLSYSKSDRG